MSYSTPFLSLKKPSMAKGYHIETDSLIAQRKRSDRFAVWQAPLMNRLLGNHQSMVRGRGIDFEELRLYQYGDELRSVDWKVTARTGQTHTRLYRQEQERPVFIVIDLSLSMRFGTRRCFKSVQAAEIAALIAWKTLASRDRIGGMIYTDSGQRIIKPRQSSHAVLELFRAMHSLDQQALAQPNNTQQPLCAAATITKELTQIVRPGSIVYLISDFYQYHPAQDRHLHQLKRHNDCTAIIVSDPMERQLPNKSKLSFSLGNMRLQVDGKQDTLRSGYQRQFEARMQQLNHEFGKHRITSLHIGTEDDALAVLNACSNKRRKRRST